MTVAGNASSHEPASLSPLELEAFGAWFATHGDTQVDHDATTVWSAHPIPGGSSNLTCVVSDRTHEWVLRRPPREHTADNAHDMAREYRVMSALAATPVPVARTVALCTDPTVLGSDFYVMEKVEGVPHRTSDELGRFSPETVAHLVDSAVEVLAHLHQVEPAAVALSDVGRPEGALAREVKRWGRHLESVRTRDLPDADALLLRLLDTVPSGDSTRDAHSASLLHGDYCLDNLLAVPTDATPIKAVVDWEVATLGDPLSDLAHLLVQDRVAHLDPQWGLSTLAATPGHLSAAEIVARYAQFRDLDPDAVVHELRFHLGLAHFRLAAVLEGIHSRLAPPSSSGATTATFGSAVEPLLAAGLAATRG